MKRVSLATSLIQKFDKDLKDRILGANISKEALNKFREKEKKNSVKVLTDLQDLKSKSESEVYEVLNTMVKNSQFFMYCGPLLLNINPGPNYIRDYLNLQSWIRETEGIEEQEWKPHLYTYMYYVYKILIEEKRDQVVNMLGQIGSGKTFNMIHIIEYYCCMVGPENRQMETFDIIHKSIQLVHIMGSIFRQNNLESTSCGILLRLGFGSDNKIANFDIEAKILDCTLPFSENGRSYSILHSFICAATNELKRNFFLPESEIHLNFFRKFGKNFSKKTKERFKLNDYEIWNRFHSLLKFFDFEKDEVIEILQIFSFLININELGMTKGEIGHMKGYMISKGQTSHRLATLLNMDEDNFIHQMGIFKDIQEIKNTLVSLMKYSYYIVFEFILFKIKKKLRSYFSEINPNIFSGGEDIKYINFLDFPGEVEDQTLGGLLTNLANECINLYAGSSYSSVVEKILKEKINLRLFRPLHSYYMLKTLMGPSGLFVFLSNAFTENNYNTLKELCNSKATFKKCIRFRENQFDSQQFKFDMHFSHTSVRYNYQSLYMETKTLVNVTKAYKIFSLSGNKIIRTVYPKVVPNKIDFFSFTYNILQSLFKPIEGLSPFVIYCLHSNNSHKLFFGNENDEYLSEDEKSWAIPKKLTQDMLKNSLCIPILYWHWFGYHEWIDIDVFLSEFEDDYIKIMEKQKEKEKEKQQEKNNGNEESIQNTNKKEENVDFKNMKPFDKANIILNNISLGRNSVVGKNTILFKTGSILKLRRKINKLLIFYGIESQKSKEKNTKLTSLLENYPTSTQTSKKNFFPKHSLKNQCDLVYIQKKKDNNMDMNNIEPKEILPINKGQKKPKKKDNNKIEKPILERNNKKDIELIELGEDDLTKKYTMFNIMDKSRNNKTNLNESLSSNDEEDFDPFLNNKDKLNDKELAAFRKKNNIIIPSKTNFELVNSLFNYNKNTNFRIFDYSKVLPEILMIQCAYRCYQARQKHLLLKYLISRITMIQKTERGNITRKKYHRLKKCLELIIRLQSNFRKKLYFVVKKVTTIQNCVRKFLAERKYERKKKRKENSLINPDEEYFDSSDEEEVKKVLIRKKKRERERKKENQRKMIENERKKKISEEAKIYKEKEIRRKKLKEKQKQLSMNMKEKIKDNKNKANMFYSYFCDINDDNEKNNNSAINKNKNKKYNIPTKKTKKDDIYEIEKEQDINKIIPALLLDKNLLKDNESMNRLLANENGVKKDIRYKLLQLENPVSKNIKRAPVDNSRIYISNSNKSSKSSFSLNNVNNEQKKKVKRIEDKLLDYGKALKQKKAQERVDKLKAEDEECTFKPKLKKRIYKNNFFNTDFYTRAAKFEEKKEKDLDTIKSKIKDDDKTKEEYTFKPKISKNSKKIKRSIDDLYNWNKEKQKKIEEKQREKQKLEDEQFELNQQTSFINNKSKILLSRKSRESSKHNYNVNDVFDLNRNEEDDNMNEGEEYNNENNDEIKFDLWPNYLEKKFFDEKEEIPLHGIKEGEYNQLDFIENKREYNESDESDEERKTNQMKENEYNNNINNININNNENEEENENEEDEE